MNVNEHQHLKKQTNLVKDKIKNTSNTDDTIKGIHEKNIIKVNSIKRYFDILFEKTSPKKTISSSIEERKYNIDDIILFPPFDM